MSAWRDAAGALVGYFVGVYVGYHVVPRVIASNETKLVRLAKVGR